MPHLLAVFLCVYIAVYSRDSFSIHSKPAPEHFAPLDNYSMRLLIGIAVVVLTYGISSGEKVN